MPFQVKTLLALLTVRYVACVMCCFASLFCMQFFAMQGYLVSSDDYYTLRHNLLDGEGWCKGHYSKYILCFLTLRSIRSGPSDQKYVFGQHLRNLRRRPSAAQTTHTHAGGGLRPPQRRKRVMSHIFEVLFKKYF